MNKQKKKGTLICDLYEAVSENARGVVLRMFTRRLMSCDTSLALFVVNSGWTTGGSGV